MARKKSETKKKTTKRKGVARTPPFAEWPEWTEAAFFSFLRSGLRAKWQRFPSRYAVIAAARRPSQSENKRLKHEYQCAICKEWFAQKDTSVDHLIPCGSLKSFDDLPGFVSRMFVGVNKLRLLCNVCHKRITKEDKENSIGKE